MKLDKDALVEFIKKERARLNEDAIPQPLGPRRRGKIHRKPYRRPDEDNTFHIQFVYTLTMLDGKRWRSMEMKGLKRRSFPYTHIFPDQHLLDDICATAFEDLKALLESLEDYNKRFGPTKLQKWGVHVVCPKPKYAGRQPYEFYLSSNEIRKGCKTPDGKWTGKKPTQHLRRAGLITLVESKDYKRLASKWLTEKRKISAEKNSRILLFEAKATGQLRKGTRELIRGTMRMLTSAIKDRDKLGLIYTKMDSIPKILHDLGLRDLNLVMYPGTSMALGGKRFQFSGRFRPGIPGPGGEPSIEIDIKYDPNTIRTPKDLRRFLSEINEGLQETLTHEVRHFWQRYGSSKLRRMRGKRGIIHRGGKRIVYRNLYDWDDTYVKAKKDYFRYLTQPSEIDAFVHGLYRRSKKTNVSFERLLKDRLDRTSLTREQKKQVFKIWMDHAIRQTPCALNDKGLPINPKGCSFSKKRKQERANKKKLRRLQQQINDNPAMKAQLREEMVKLKTALEAGATAGAASPGKFKQILRRLPIIGRIMAWSAFVGFTIHGADQAYARGGAKALAKYSASTLADLTPIVGDIKGIIELMRMAKPRPIPPEIRNMIGHPSSRYR